MPLPYQPKAGSVLMCDFKGYVMPEIIKKRPVIVLARNKFNQKLVTVVPLSTTKPDILRPHHHQISKNPIPKNEAVLCWAKCDMLATVSLERLDRIKTHDRNYIVPELSLDDFLAIKHGVLNALGLTTLTHRG